MTKIIVATVPLTQLTITADKCWLDYAAGGKITHKSSTWAADYVTDGIDLKMRPLVTVEPIPGLMVIVR